MNLPIDSNRGQLILVAGHSRHVGKTTVVEALLRGLPAGEWSAVKISSHRHAAPGSPFIFTEEKDRSGDSQTARYLRGGASRSFLLRAPDSSLPVALTPLMRVLADGMNLIVESNRLARYCRPDLVVFVIAPEIQDWKASSGDCLKLADALVLNGPGGLPPVAEAIAGANIGHVPRFRFSEILAGLGHSKSLNTWILSKIHPSPVTGFPSARIGTSDGR